VGFGASTAAVNDAIDPITVVDFVRTQFEAELFAHHAGEAERVEMLIRKEAYRPLTVREGDKVSRMPALQGNGCE
jgi:hypothetical protein